MLGGAKINALIYLLEGFNLPVTRRVLTIRP